ncbi:recombinase family protein [Streptomyces sp. Vc74B-19]|uniref:recombinase family protein n=1 Tax=unclassified Streptomyces TaxID=2593676 RepID=UPI001BFC8D1E|nr:MULTISPECIES: recombinase family protein [unclassified Streptomyces]MBT3163522.1 recombinase family protein [Streptomyces sp. Vc74B-19]
MNLHVAGYTRQSYGRVNGSETSPASQRAANHARFELFAKESAHQGRDAVWCGHYEDVGISAYSGTERPDFERLLRDCRMGRVNVMIVYNISRLSRLEPRDAIPIVNELLSLGVTIVSTTEGIFRPGDTMDLIHLIFRLDAAHQESKNKSTAVRDAAAQARALGGYVGGKAPYGRRFRQEIRMNAEGKPVAVQLLDVEPAQADVIRRVWKLISEGSHTIGSLCTMLNTEGVATLGTARGKKSAGSSWYPKTLITMLRHPHVAGFDADAIYSAEGRVTGHRIRRDAEGRPLAAWEPILSPEDWFALQEWLDARPVRANAPRSSGLLSSQGIMGCACGYTMSANNSERPSYFCNRPAGKPLSDAPGDHLGRSYISRRALDDFVVRSIFGLIAAAEYDDDSRDVLARVAAHYAEVNETAETAQERRTLVQERADATRALTQLYDDADLYRGDAIGRQRWANDIRTQQARVAAADARLEDLGREGTLTLPIHEWSASDDPDWNGDPLGPGTWWASASLGERRSFVALFVKRITVRKALPSEKSRGNKAAAVIEPRVTIEWV